MIPRRGGGATSQWWDREWGWGVRGLSKFSSYPPMGSTTIPLGDTSPSMDRVRLFPL